MILQAVLSISVEHVLSVAKIGKLVEMSRSGRRRLIFNLNDLLLFL